MARDNSIQFRMDGVDYVLRGDKSREQLETKIGRASCRERV